MIVKHTKSHYWRLRKAKRCVQCGEPAGRFALCEGCKQRRKELRCGCKHQEHSGIVGPVDVLSIFELG